MAQRVNSDNQARGDVDGTHDVSSADSGGSLKKSLLRLIKRDEVSLITSAKRTPLQALEHKQRVYGWLQGSRVPFLLLSAVTYMWWHNMVVSAILFTISVPLPWIAVVIGNSQGEVRDKRHRNTYKPQAARDYWATKEAESGLNAPNRHALEQGSPATEDTSATDSATFSSGAEVWEHDEVHEPTTADGLTTSSDEATTHDAAPQVDTDTEPSADFNDVAEDCDAAGAASDEDFVIDGTWQVNSTLVTEEDHDDVPVAEVKEKEHHGMFTVSNPWAAETAAAKQAVADAEQKNHSS